MIPVSVITGFLGSGKTTLLRHLLRDPAMARTAVIVNEFGEVGLDHELIEASDENFVQLTTGCLCCKVRSDLVLTLTDLAQRRTAGTVPAFDRVVIETSGLADPAPILHALMTDRDLAATYTLGPVITTADALNGMDTLDRHLQSRRQMAVADRVVVTKADLVQGRIDNFCAHIRALNPGAALLTAVRGAIAPSALFPAATVAYGTVTDDHTRLPLRLRTWVPPAALANVFGNVSAPPAHNQGISSFCLVRDNPVRAVAFALFLEALADNCGADLLRVKGLVQIAERPESPAVIHGVQHVFHPPEWLDHWPSPDHRTRIVFIVQEIPHSWLENLLDLLDAEVADCVADQASPAL